MRGAIDFVDELFGGFRRVFRKVGLRLLTRLWRFQRRRQFA